MAKRKHKTDAHDAVDSAVDKATDDIVEDAAAAVAADEEGANAAEAPDAEAQDVDVEAFERMRAELEEMRGERDRHLRQLADALNRQRRLDAERDRERRYLAAEMLVGLLPLDDDLGRAVQALETERTGLGDGVALIGRNLREIFERFNVRRLEPEGEIFDPNLHEAVSMREEPDAAPNAILEVMQAGYVLEDRVLRPARVVVAKAASAVGDDDEGDSDAESGDHSGAESGDSLGVEDAPEKTEKSD